MGDEEDYSAEIARRANYKTPGNSLKNEEEIEERMRNQVTYDFSLIDGGSIIHHFGVPL